MQVLLVISVISTVVGAIQQKNQLDAQAKLFNQQAALEAAEGDRREAVEKASSAEEGASRARDLRRFVGEIIAKAANAGLGQIGTVGALIEESGAQFAEEQGNRNFNLGQSLTSIGITSASRVQSLRTQASVAKSRGRSALISGIGSAAGSLATFGQREDARGETP